MRDFLKATKWETWTGRGSDQTKGVPRPKGQNPIDANQRIVDLPKSPSVITSQLESVLCQRRSRRKFLDEPLSLNEVAFLLAFTQGITGKSPALRAVPSAGASHPFETYLWVRKVDGLSAGLYRYLPLDHKLVVLQLNDNLADAFVDACRGQSFVSECSVAFIWTAVPYRTEWRYEDLSPKLIALDAGHVCQNLYIAAEAIKAGTCAIAAYHQQKMDEFLGVDGEDEFTIYLAPVGKVQV